MILFVGLSLASCGSDQRIELGSALGSMKQGEFRLVVITDEFISFQRDGYHKYQYYFTPPLSETVISQVKAAVEEARAKQHEIHFEDFRKRAAELPQTGN